MDKCSAVMLSGHKPQVADAVIEAHSFVGVKVMRFSLGQVVATPGALRALEQAEQLPAKFLDRHVNGDWGEVPEADKQENEFSVEHGFRILSAYTTSAAIRFGYHLKRIGARQRLCCPVSIDGEDFFFFFFFFFFTFAVHVGREGASISESTRGERGTKKHRSLSGAQVTQPFCRHET